jgi:hypothetical protein
MGELIFTNEREIPRDLPKLLKMPNLPNGLKTEITEAIDQVKNYGAVTYATAARLHHYLEIHYDAIDDFLKKRAKQTATKSKKRAPTKKQQPKTPMVSSVLTEQRVREIVNEEFEKYLEFQRRYSSYSIVPPKLTRKSP